MRARLALIVLLLAGPAWGQSSQLDDLPKMLVPKQAPTRQETQRRDALKAYALGLICEHEDRLLEALKAFENAARLDPAAAPVYKAQVPILLALERTDEALVVCRKALELAPEDHESWYIAFRLYKGAGQPKEARAALVSGLGTEAIKEHPEAAQQMYLDLAGLCETSDDPAGAADAYAKAVAILEHPDLILEKGNFSRDVIANRAAETYERIGTLYRKAKNYAAAADAYRKAQARAPEHAGRLHLHLAQLAVEQQAWPTALASVDAYLRNQPLGLEAYELRVELLDRLGRHKEIVPWLEQAAVNDRFNTGLHLLLARELGKAKQLDRAAALYQTLAEKAPTVDVYRGLFALYQSEGKAGLGKVLTTLDGALARANHAEDDPNAPPAPPGALTQAKAALGALRQEGELAKQVVQAAYTEKQPPERNFATQHFLAVLADRHRQAAAAERFYRQCLPHVTPSNEALVYGGLLRVLNRSHQYEAVIAVCQDGLKKTKATSPLLFLSDQARAQAGLDRFEEALKTVERGFPLCSDDHRLVFQILKLRILTMAERFDAAEAGCQALLKEPRPAGEVLELRYLLSGIYAASKQSAKAEEQLALVLKLDPDNATANNDLGYVWAEQGKELDKAETMIRRALAQDRRQRQQSVTLSATEDVDNASYVDSLGWVLFRRGKLDEAKQELERAAALPDSDDPVIYDHLGDVYAGLQQMEPARSAWQRALRLYDEGKRRREPERVRALERKLHEKR